MKFNFWWFGVIFKSNLLHEEFNAVFQNLISFALTLQDHNGTDPFLDIEYQINFWLSKNCYFHPCVVCRTVMGVLRGVLAVQKLSRTKMAIWGYFDRFWAFLMTLLKLGDLSQKYYIHIAGCRIYSATSFQISSKFVERKTFAGNLIRCVTIKCHKLSYRNKLLQMFICYLCKQLLLKT